LDWSTSNEIQLRHGDVDAALDRYGDDARHESVDEVDEPASQAADDSRDDEYHQREDDRDDEDHAHLPGGLARHLHELSDVFLPAPAESQEQRHQYHGGTEENPPGDAFCTAARLGANDGADQG